MEKREPDLVRLDRWLTLAVKILTIAALLGGFLAAWLQSCG